MLGKDDLRARYIQLSGEKPEAELQWDQLADAVILLYEKECGKKDKEIEQIKEEMKTIKQIIPKQRICCVCFNSCGDASNCSVCDRPVHEAHGVVNEGEGGGSYGKGGVVCDTCRRLERLQLTAIDQITHQLDIKSQLDNIQAIILSLYKIDLETIKPDDENLSHSSGSCVEEIDDTIQVGYERNGGVKRKSAVNAVDWQERDEALYPTKYQKTSQPLSPVASPDTLSPSNSVQQVHDSNEVKTEIDGSSLGINNELMLKEYVESRPKTKTIKGFAYHTLVTRKLLQATCPFCPNKCFRNPKGFEDHLVKKHDGKSLPLYRTLPVELQLCILADSKTALSSSLINVN